jgi:hypothetical protein
MIKQTNVHLWPRLVTPGSSLLNAATNVAGSVICQMNMRKASILANILATTGVHLEVDCSLSNQDQL